MNAVVLNIMCGDTPDRLDGESFAADFNLVALHCLLDSSADIAYTHVDSSVLWTIVSHCSSSSISSRRIYLDPCVGGIFDSSKKVVICRVKRHGECAVDDPAIDMDAKVNFHDVLIL